MALKENIQAIKEELTTQEQFLENIIKSERFFKKNKFKIITLAIILVGGIAYYAISNIVKDRNLQVSNEAFVSLMQNPDNQTLVDVLKKKNEPLYRVHMFQRAIQTNDTGILKDLVAKNSSDLIEDLSSYLIGETKENSVLENYIKFQKGYDLLKNGKASEANLLFQTIPTDSGLNNVVIAVEHYQFKNK